MLSFLPQIFLSFISFKLQSNIRFNILTIDSHTTQLSKIKNIETSNLIMVPRGSFSILITSKRFLMVNVWLKS